MSCVGILKLSKLFDNNENSSPIRLNRYHWNAIRLLISEEIGRPRRFSKAFLRTERNKLNAYRQVVRKVQYGSILAQISHGKYTDTSLSEVKDFPYKIASPYQVGDCVAVYNKQTQQIQKGQILMTMYQHVNVPKGKLERTSSAAFTDGEIDTESDSDGSDRSPFVISSALKSSNKLDLAELTKSTSSSSSTSSKLESDTQYTTAIDSHELQSKFYYRIQYSQSSIPDELIADEDIRIYGNIRGLTSLHNPASLHYIHCPTRPYEFVPPLPLVSMSSTSSNNMNMLTITNPITVLNNSPDDPSTPCSGQVQGQGKCVQKIQRPLDTPSNKQLKDISDKLYHIIEFKLEQWDAYALQDVCSMGYLIVRTPSYSENCPPFAKLRCATLNPIQFINALNNIMGTKNYIRLDAAHYPFIPNCTVVDGTKCESILDGLLYMRPILYKVMCGILRAKFPTGITGADKDMESTAVTSISPDVEDNLEVEDATNATNAMKSTASSTNTNTSVKKLPKDAEYNINPENKFEYTRLMFILLCNLLVVLKDMQEFKPK